MKVRPSIKKLCEHCKVVRREGINRVILCSDGVANVGNTEADVILSEIRGYVEEGVTMTTIGFGMDNYNDTLMEQLADNGDGFYAYVDDMREAKRLFIDNLTSTLQTIALDAKVQVDFNPEVVMRYRLVGFENRAVAEAIAPVLAARGLLLVGLDVIGENVTEINVTSPTCFQEISAQTGVDVAALFVDALERRLR